jgi:abortive infection bacteriophage resistance protein
MATPHAKPWLCVQDQLRKLAGYGLVIADTATATQFLEHINYYRFSGYGLAFEQSRHVFLPGTTFEAVRQAYEFDRALRDLVTEALEIIELDLRTTIAYWYGKTYQTFGHRLARNFHDRSAHRQWIKKLRDETRRSREAFVNHHRVKYAEFPDLPIWVATEIMSFGSLSRMYANLIKTDQKPIAARYHLQPLTLASWIHHLVYVRNLCAHHSRLWDLAWDIKPEFPPGKVWQPPSVPSNARLFASLLIQNAILRCCPAERRFAAEWRRRVEELLTRSLPTVPKVGDRMDLPTDWLQHPLWATV